MSAGLKKGFGPQQPLDNPAQRARLRVRGFAGLGDQLLIFGWPSPLEDEPPLTVRLAIDGVEMRGRFRDHNQAVVNPDPKLEFAHRFSFGELQSRSFGEFSESLL